MLVIKKSQIPGAGKGLYTTKPIKNGAIVCEYKGEIITWKEYERRVELDMDGYLFYVNDNYCIDAFNCPNEKARYANDANGIVKVKGLKNNAEYEIIEDKAFIVATADIAAGSEIFVDYTEEYWEAIRHNIELYKKESENKTKSVKTEKTSGTKSRKRKKVYRELAKA